MANIRNQALAWKNYLRNKQEEDERKKQEAETVAKVSALSNGLTTNQNANILKAATLGATQAAQNTSTFDQYRNALTQSRAKMQGLQNRVLAQNQAAARQVGIQKNPLMPQFNDKRAATFHEDVQRKAQNLWKEHKENQRVNQYFDDNSVAGLTKKKQGYEDAAQKSKTNIQQYLKDAFAKDPDGERLINTFGLDEEYNDDDLRELWKNGMLSSQSFRESHPGVDWQGIDDNLGSYFENKTRSAGTDADLLWQKTYENPEGLIKAAKGRDDYDKLVNSYNEDQFWAQRLANYDNPSFSGDGRVADFLRQADQFANLGETASDFRTIAGNKVATANEVLADADQQAREKWIAKYGNNGWADIDKKDVNYLIGAAREIGDRDLEDELRELKVKSDAEAASIREGTDEVMAYLKKDEKDALRYWMQYGNETGDYTNANVLYEGLWAKAGLRKRDSDTEDWNFYANRNGTMAWMNNRWQAFKSGLYAIPAAIATKQHGEDAVYSKWFDPAARSQVQESVIQKNASEWINSKGVGKWFNNGIGKALGCDAGDVLNFLMESADSYVDNVFRDLPAIAGVPGWHYFSLGVMSASSFNNTLYNDLMAGRDRESAMKHALAEGTIEYLTEKIGGEAATNWIEGSNILSYWLKTGGAEATEEFGGGIAGNFLERVNNDYHNGVWQGALQQVNANPSIGFMAALAQQQRAQDLEPVKAAASAFLSMLPGAVTNIGTYRQIRRNEAMDEAQGEMRLNSDDVSQIQQLEAERSGLTDEQRELLAEQERRRSGSLEDRKAAMTEIMEREAQGQQTEEPETTVPGPQVDIAERKAGNIEEGRRNPYEEGFQNEGMAAFASSLRDQVPGPRQSPEERRAANIEEGQQAELEQLKEQWSEANDEVNQLQDEIFEATQSGVQGEEVQAKRDQLRDAIQRRDDLMARAEEIRYNAQGSAGQEDAPKPRRTAAQVRESNIEDTTEQYPERETKETAPGPQQTVDQRRAANVEEGQKEPTPPAPRRSTEQMREGNVEETTNQTLPEQQTEKQTPPGPQRKIDERRQANVEDGKKPKQKKSELAAMRERIAGMSDDAITARLGEIAERRASLEAELARRKDVVNKRGKTIEKLVKTATGAKVKAATAEEMLGETKQDSAVSTGDLGDGKTIKSLDKDGNIIASDGSTISAKNVDWDTMPATKEVYDTAMELSEDYNVAPGVVFAAYADGMRASVFRSGARAIVSAARAGTSLQSVLNNHRAAAALDPRMVQAMYDQAAEKGVQFARERTEVAAKLKPLESGEGNVSMTPEAAEFLKGLKPDNTILQSVQVINDLFGKHGPKIQFFLAGEGAEQGAINKAADTIRVALDAGDKGGMVQSAILQVLPHELTHMIATRYVDGYVKLQRYISDYLTSQGKSLDDYVEDIRAEYKAAGVDLTAEQATEEAVAKASELVLKDSKFAERVANNNPSLANRIVDWLRSMKARIASIFKNYKPLSAIARDMQDAMDGYVKIWDDALENALNIKREQTQDIETVKGDEGTAYTASNEEIGFHYELVDAFDLTASNDYETMLENPLYPSELQPRDRSRQASEDQIDSIVRELNPNRLMGSSEVSTGAPIVGPDYIVESGNGRTIALQRVMKQGGKNAQKYTEALRQRAAEYGFKPEDVKDGQVLVRVRDSAMNNAQRAEFAKASNVSATMTSAAAETAASDAQKLSSKALDLYNPDGDSQSNTGFFLRFLNEVVPESERNSMLTRTGQPSQALINRAKVAMFYRAYDSNELTQHMSEQADPEAKNTVTAMMNVAARVASIVDQIQGGTLHDINFAADIANAAAQFIELKRTGQDVNDWLNQSSMFEQDDTMRAIVGLMEKYKRSAVKLTGAFNSILDQVEAAGNPEQESMFGDDTLPTKQEIIQRAEDEEGTRYSLKGQDGMRFSMKAPVEQVRDLVAVHNINEENLERSIIKGGFPGPSIAIVKSKLGHNRFGELSVVFRPKTIDPGADARNAVFGGDAWTPQYPKVSRAVREEDILKVNDALNSNLSNIKFPGLKSETRNYILKHAGEIHKQGAKEYFGNYFDRFIDGKLIALFLAEQDYGPEMIAEANKKATNDPLKLKGALGYLTDVFNKKPAYMDEYVSWLDDIGSRLSANGSGKITSKSTGETYEETPENVIKVMFESGNRNATGPDEVAATAKRYGSLEQIQEERGRLPSTIDERLALHADEHAISDAIDDAAYDLERLLDVAKIYDHNHQEIRDMVIRAVGQRNDTGETIFGILNDRLNKKGYGYILNEAPYQRKLEELANILEDVNARSQGNMTAYFEAKPERVVGLDEIEAVIVPKWAKHVQDTLQQHGVKYLEYDGTDDDRLEKLNSLADARFSLRSSDADYMAAVERGDMDEAQRMVDEAAEEAMKGSKIRDEDGKLRKVYHGTEEDFTVFDRTKGRANMDIQGMFFSPWEEDAGGYGGKVRSFYLDIRNPASEGVGYKALNRYKGQNQAGVKARDDLEKMGYDGVNNEDMEFIAFYPEQIKLADPVTYDDAGNVIPISERFNPENEDIRYSLRGESELSDREVLGEAMKEIAKTGGDQLYLDRYQQAYNELTGFQKDLKKQERIMAASASNTDEYRAASNRAAVYQEKIGRAEEKLESMESDPRFDQMVRAERERAEAAVARDYESGSPVEQEREELIRGYERKLRDRRRALDKYRADRNTSADRSRYIERITDTAKGLSELLYTNTDKKHVPEALKKPLGDFLNALNLYSKRYNEGGSETQKDLKLSQYLRRVQDAVRKSENINEAGDYTGELYLPQGFVDQIADLAQTIENLEQTYKDADPVVHMNNDSLKKLDLTLRALKKAINDVNKLYTNAAYQKVSDMGRASIHYLNGFTPMSKRNGKFKQYLNWDMATPVYAMDRFGKVGQSLFKAIRDGYGQRAQRLNEIEEYAAEHWTAKEAKAWKDEIKTFTFDRFDEEGNSAPVEVKLTVSQIMELYLAMKRDQAVQHAENGGIRARTITEGSKTLINQPDAAHLDMDEIRQITDSLTDRQREVSDAMGKYMKTTSDWGNEVSMRRFGYRAFGEANYWPISTDEFSRDGVPEQGQVQGSNLYRLLNMSFTKALNPHANNALLLNGAFETFAAHTTDMATYSTMALPALDMIKWYNFREKLDDGQTMISTRGAMSRTYGDEAAKYIRNLISDFSGSTRTVERGTENQIYSALMSHAKRAAVAGNLSVVLKQPGSILRAGYVLPRAAYLRPSALISRHDYNEMLEHSGIACWKSMGYFDTNLSKPMEAKIAGDEKWTDRFVEIMTKGAEWADKNTMVSIWKAAKAQVVHDNKGIDTESEEYFQKVTDLFEDIIYRTQVVDSTLTRSQSMRNPGFLGKTINAFMAEPTLSYNVMMDALTDVVEDHRQGKKGISKATGKKIAAASTTYVMTQVIQALVGAMMGAWRDDDDYKTFMDKFWDRVGSSITEELNPINSIPLVSFLLDSLNGDNSSVADSGLVQLRYAFNGFKKIFWKDGKFNENWQEDMANDWQKLTRYSVSAASYLSGLPGMNLAREVWNVWNNTMDLTGNQELKFHPYSASDSNKARAAMYYDAIRRGDQAAIERLEKIMEINGFTGDKFRDAFNDVVKEDFLGGGISQEEAENILIKYNGYEETGSKSAYHFLTGAAYKDATGAKSYSMYIPLQTALLKGDADGIKAAQRELVDHYGIKEKDIPGKTGESIRDMYKDGKITRAEAERLLRTYTDDTALEIDKALDKAQFKGENPDFDMDDWSYYQGIFDLIDQSKDIKAEVRANYSYSTADQINSAVKSYIKKSYQEGRISASQLEQKLKQYATYSDAYGAYWAAQEIVYETANPGKDYHYIDSLVAAMDRGAGVQSEITRMLSHGKTGEGISAQLTSHYKPLWKAGNANTRAAIQQKMVAAWQALGYTNKQIQTKLKNLQKNWAK